MPTYEILVRGRAAKQIKQLPREYFRLVRRHIDGLTDDPRPPDAKRLKGNLGYSLRVGVYRILYDVDDETQTVTIYRVKHRRDVYRRL
jgi:mRNA interferase RelE/StbE